MPPPAATPALLHTTWTFPNASNEACAARSTLSGIGHIADGAAYIGRDFLQAFDGGLQRIRLDIGQHHFHAGLGKRPAERKSDACGPAGHEGCLAGELSHGRFLPGFELPYLHDAAPAASEFR